MSVFEVLHNVSISVFVSSSFVLCLKLDIHYKGKYMCVCMCVCACMRTCVSLLVCLLSYPFPYTDTNTPIPSLILIVSYFAFKVAVHGARRTMQVFMRRFLLLCKLFRPKSF